MGGNGAISCSSSFEFYLHMCFQMDGKERLVVLALRIGDLLDRAVKVIVLARRRISDHHQ